MKSEAMTRLGERIGSSDVGSEDWDLILANSARVDEYCDLYDSNALPDEEKQLLMQLIVASLDDLLRVEPNAPSHARVQRMLERDRTLHAQVIKYWAHGDKKVVWKVTPMMRRLRVRFEAT
jgi:hypothetical protein